MIIIRKPIFTGIVALIAAVFFCTGCNTFQGMGKDIEGAGKAIQRTVDKTKKSIDE